MYTNKISTLVLAAFLCITGYSVASEGDQSTSDTATWKKYPGIWMDDNQNGPQDASNIFWNDYLFDDSSWNDIMLPDEGISTSSQVPGDRYYRLHFNWDGLSHVTINMASDDGLSIYINGNLLGEWGAGWRVAGCVNNPGGHCHVDVTVPGQVVPLSMLQTGDNVIAVDTWDAATSHHHLSTTVTLSSSGCLPYTSKGNMLMICW